MRALIVDDDPGIRLLLAHFLRQRGHEVDEAAGRAEALSTAQQTGPDVVFLDQFLPDGDGEELIGPLTSPWVGASVVVMTAHADVNRALRCVKKGADYFLRKPFDLDQVDVILDKLEEKRRLQRNPQ